MKPTYTKNKLGKVSKQHAPLDNVAKNINCRSKNFKMYSYIMPLITIISSQLLAKTYFMDYINNSHRVLVSVVTHFIMF